MAEITRRPTTDPDCFAYSSYSYPVGDIKKSPEGDTSPSRDEEPFFEFACVQCDQKMPN